MRTKLVGFLAGMLIAVSALGATSAAAATEFGDSCVANDVTGVSATLFEITANSNALPTTAPSAGVITSWKSILAAPVSVPQTLEVLRPTSPTTVQIVGESAQNITEGLNAFATRIPVQAGDRLGLFGGSEFGNLVCELEGINLIGGFGGSGGGVGSTISFFEIEARRIPVSAILEPDADNDGYGDETQDKCPQNAATQGPCPVVPTVAPIALSTSSTVKKTLANVLVTSNSQAPVTVAGTVKLGKGKSAALSGGTQVVVPGAIAKFTLLFPEKLKAKLKQLSPKQFLWLNLAATAPNSAGVIGASSLKVKLKGQAKPLVHAKAKPKGQA